MANFTTVTSPSVPAQRANARRLVILRCPESERSGEALVLGDNPLTVGREVGDGILHLADDEVSRRHCIIEPVENGRHCIRDLGSRNHTFVHGHQIETHELADCDIIRVGGSVLLYEELSIDPKAKLAPENAHLMGGSMAIASVRGAVEAVATRPIPVLVLGETGSGKERVAGAIHASSDRSGLFIPVNCAAIPEHLFESELFGHTASAFTGAARAKEGLFDAADKGTLFLDEVGEIPLPLQSKLLRALADGEIRPVGSNTSHKVDVRVIAATSVQIRAAIDQNEFRGDLYARLAGWTIEVPPLRTRRSDILALAHHFLHREGIPRGCQFTSHAVEALHVYSWPFNVRELEQAMRAVSVRLGRRKEIEINDLPSEVHSVLSHRVKTSSTELPLALRVNPKTTPNAAELREVLEHFDGNVAQVATFFGRDRRQIYRWAETTGVDVTAFRVG